MNDKSRCKEIAKNIKNQILSGSFKNGMSEEVKLETLLWLGDVLRYIFGKEIELGFVSYVDFPMSVSKEDLKYIIKEDHVTIYDWDSRNDIGIVSWNDEGKDVSMYFFPPSMKLLKERGTQ